MDITSAYEILNVNATTSFTDITKAYRKLVVKIHPDKNKAPNAQETFTNIRKAYEYLKKNDPKSTTSSQSQPPPPKQPEPNEFDIELTLEEIFTGCKMQKEISIKVVDANEKVTRKRKALVVVVNRGAIGGSRIVIPQEGDLYHGQIPANVVFIVREKPHKHFKRTRFDLEYTARLTIEQACSRKVKVPLIEDPKKKIQIQVDQVITQSTVELVKGKGMPIPTDINKRGDLLVHFDIIYEKDKMQDPPIEYDLMLTLEEVFKGARKKMNIERKIVNPFDGTSKMENKTLLVEIPAGVETDAKFTFPREGDQKPETIPADVIFVVKIAPHLYFTRQGQNIQYTALLSVTEHARGCTLDIPTLDGEIRIEEITKDTFVSSKSFPNKGLPFPSEPNKRGDLTVIFKVLADSYVDKPIERDLPLTVQNILYGCTKRFKISRIIVDQYNNEFTEKKTVRIKVEPGTVTGHRFTFSRIGNKRPNYIPADMIWKVMDKEHPQFKRRGADIEYTAHVRSLASESTIDIPTIEGTTLQLSLDNIFKFGAVKKFIGNGLPLPDNATKRGNLLVKIVKSEHDEEEEEPKSKAMANVNIQHGGGDIERDANGDIRTADVVISRKESACKSGRTRSPHSVRALKVVQPNLNKDPTIEHQLPLSLENVLSGCIKKLKISRTITDENGTETNENEIITIDVPAGTEAGHRFTFKEMGDQMPGRIAADIVFVAQDKPHDVFVRDGADIVYKCIYSDRFAVLQIPTLEGDFKSLQLGLLFQNNQPVQFHRFDNLGLPLSNNPKERGDLVVECTSQVNIVNEKLRNFVEKVIKK